jgi:hypothetical protein
MPSQASDGRHRQPVYTMAERQRAIGLAAEIGAHQASKQLGVGYNTLRRWIDPEFREQQYAEGRARKRQPCERCGHQTNLYSRKHPELGLLCRSCLATALADRRRGYTVADLARMYQDEGMSTNEIAAVTGQTQSGIHALLRRHGVTTRTRQQGIALRPGGSPEHDKIDPREARHLARQGMPPTKRASTLACSVSTVMHHLQQAPTTAYQPTQAPAAVAQPGEAPPPYWNPADDDLEQLHQDIQDFSDRKLSAKQQGLGVFLVTHRYVRTAAHAVQVLDGIREFNALERRTP